MGIYADLGLFDDPAQQRQESYTIDMSARNMLIIGALQTGKTNILQLLIRTLSDNYTPDEVNFYIIDYSSMILTNFQNLAHVGGVVVPNEDEKLKNLFKLLTTEIVSRKQKLKEAGVSSFTSYKESGKCDLPLIILMIDNFASLKELNLNDNTVLLSILRDGLSVGISVVVANGSTKGMEYKYLSSFACCIGLHHNNSDEYGNLFGAFKLSVDAIPGRCLVEVDKKILECQLYQSFDGEKEFQRAENIKAFVDEINIKYPDQKTLLIPEIPEFIMEKDVRKQYSSYFSPYHIILGFDYDSLMPMKFNLSGLNMIVSGIPKSGKGNFIRYMVSCLDANSASAPVQIVIFDKATIKKYESLSKKYNCITSYELSSENMKSICQEWKAELESRKQLVLEHHGDMSVLDDKPLLMMICEDSGKEMLNNFDDSLFDYLAYKFTWIASNASNDDISPMKAPKLYKAKTSGAGCMIFGSVSASKIFDGFIKISLSEKNERLNKDVNKGDSFYVDANDPTTVYRLKTVIHQE